MGVERDKRRRRKELGKKVGGGGRKRKSKTIRPIRNSLSFFFSHFHPPPFGSLLAGGRDGFIVLLSNIPGGFLCFANWWGAWKQIGGGRKEWIEGISRVNWGEVEILGGFGAFDDWNKKHDCLLAMPDC